MDDYEAERNRKFIADMDKYFHDKYFKPVDDAMYVEYQRRAGERKSR
jgi:hypothetical protein